MNTYLISDLVCHYDDFDEYTEIAQKHLRGFHFEDRGFAEYCQMLYHPYCTTDRPNSDLPNGHFRVDSYNSFFFRSAIDDFELGTMRPFAGYWTVPHAFNELVFRTSQRIDGTEYKFEAPSSECDIVLLIMRNVLDQQGVWKKKHIDRLVYLVDNAWESKLCHALIEAKLARPYDIIDALHDQKLEEVGNIILNG